jgi:formamidopyrimidine-DNA glycosylase
MPELPEVETIKRSLNKHVTGKEIIDLKVFRQGLLQGITPQELRSKVVGEAFESVKRRAKYLIFHLNDYSIVLHLGLEGLFFLKEEDTENIQLVFHFEDKTRLYFDDIKNYSRLFLVRSQDAPKIKPISRLGIEPFTESYTFQNFAKLLNSRQEIKRLLLDQAKIAGVGNIYASEVLFVCGIHPKRKAKDLSPHQARCLYEEVPKLLERAISKRGTSVFHYRDIDGSKGEFQNYLRVYNRKGEPCYNCGAPLEEIDQGGRKTYFCPNCQK